MERGAGSGERALRLGESTGWPGEVCRAVHGVKERGMAARRRKRGTRKRTDRLTTNYTN